MASWLALPCAWWVFCLHLELLGRGQSDFIQSSENLVSAFAAAGWNAGHDRIFSASARASVIRDDGKPCVCSPTKLQRSWVPVSEQPWGFVGRGGRECV